MGDFIGDRECITHHYACDCREKMFADRIAELESALADERRLRKLDHDEVVAARWLLTSEGLPWSLDSSFVAGKREDRVAYCAARAANEGE